MQSRLFTLLLAGAALLPLVGCSENENFAPDGPSTKTLLVLGNYFDENGKPVSLTWNASDCGRLIVAETGECFEANPIIAGQSSSFFRFEMPVPEDAGNAFVSYYPENADFKVSADKVEYSVATAQDGAVASPVMWGKTFGPTTASDGLKIELKPVSATLYVVLPEGNFTVEKITVAANGGVGIAGNVAEALRGGAVTASSASVEVTLPDPLNCLLTTHIVPVQVAPVNLPQGYSVKLGLADGNEISYAFPEAVSFAQGERFATDADYDFGALASKAIVYCGDKYVKIVNPTLAANDVYTKGLVWSYDVRDAADYMGLARSSCDHLDDCKPVDGGSKLLLTSSYSWTLLLDIAEKKPLFYATGTQNAHSAELLPGNKLVVACSSGDNGNCLQLFDLDHPNEVLFTTELSSAHGVVWVEETQRLYAIGGNKLNIYTLKNADTMTPSLELEKQVKTPKSGTHDLTKVDGNRILVSGRGAYFYDLAAGTFTPHARFDNSTGVKSTNCNPVTGECWFTDATIPEGTQTWSTRTLRYTTDMNDPSTPQAPNDPVTISVPDQDVYKVRVLAW